MVRGPRHHLKRLNAPRHWMLDKMSGVFAPRPSSGPHKLRECLPLIILLRNKLKYALTRNEVTKIVRQRLIKVDGRVRTDGTFPAGFMDVVTIEKTGEQFRLLFDTKGRFVLLPISVEEAKFKLCKVKRVQVGPRGIPFITTHDGRSIRYPDPLIKSHDSVKVDIATGKIVDYVKFDTGNVVMVTAGRNLGRVGVLVSKEKHPGSFDIVHVRDAAGNDFATRLGNVFVIGKSEGKTTKALVSLPRDKGIKKSILEEAAIRLQKESVDIKSVAP